MKSATRSLLVGCLLASILAIIATLAPSARTAVPGPNPGVDGCALFANDLLRTKSRLSVDGLPVCVNDGSLLTHGPLLAGSEDVIAGTGPGNAVRLRPGSQCGRLFTDPSRVTSANCSGSPVAAFTGPIVPDLATACGFPKSPPACGTQNVTVGHDGVQHLEAGRYGVVLVRGTPEPGTLVLDGGSYVFCSLRVASGARLLIAGSAAQVFVAGEVQFFTDSQVGPVAGTPAPDASHIRFFVNGDTVRLSRRSRFTGHLCAPNGLLGMGADATATGGLAARVISTDRATVHGLAAAPPTTTTTTTSTTSTSSSTSTTHTTTTTTSTSTSTTSTSTTSTSTTSTSTTSTSTTSTSTTSTSTTSTSTTHTTTTTSTTSTTTSTSSTTSSTSSTTTTTSTTSTSTTSTSTSTTTSSTSSTTTTTSTTSTSTTSTTTSTSTTQTTSTTSTTTTLPSQFSLTVLAGTSNCGTGGLATNPSPPLSGELDNGTPAKIKDLGLGCLYFGGGNNTFVPGAPLPNGSMNTLGITSIVGTTVNLGGVTGAPGNCSVGVAATMHCAKVPATSCTSNAQCTTSGDQCIPDANCYFSQPFPIPNPVLGALSTCVQNVVAADESGTISNYTTTGDMTLNVPLSSRVYLTTNLASPCPRCLAGKCNAGDRVGLGCTAVGTLGTTLDCPPASGTFVTPLAIPLNVTSGTASSTVATGIFCTGDINHQQLHAGAFGQSTTRTIKETGAPAGNLSDGLTHGGTLAGVFCVPKTGNGSLDPVADLPGPGAVSINANLMLH